MLLNFHQAVFQPSIVSSVVMDKLFLYILSLQYLTIFDKNYGLYNLVQDFLECWTPRIFLK